MKPAISSAGQTLARLPALLGAGVLLTLAACSSVPVDSTRSMPSPRPTAPHTAPAAPAASPGAATRGGGYYLDDGPGDNAPADLAAIPDAVPRVEALRSSNTRPYVALGQTFTPMTELKAFEQEGVGSWYGRKFHGARTASGERYDMYGMTAAHPTLPLPSYARVTNLENGRQVVVRINDRGPFLRSRIIDLSYTAAWKLGYVNKGHARLRVEAITHDEISGGAVVARATPMPAAPVSVVRPVARPALVAAPEPIAVAAVAEAPAPPAPRMPVMPTAAPAPLPASADPAARAASQPVAAAVAPAATEPAGVFLQLGAFASSANAESFRDYVKSELKWLAQTVSTRLIGDKYRLRVGPFADAGEARSAAERIASAIGTRPFVVQ